MGRLIRSSEFDGENNLIQRIEQLYDKANRLEKQSWVIDGDSYSESYTYNDPVVGADASARPKDGSLASVTTATGDTVSYGYDALKRVVRETVKNGEDTRFYTAYAYKDVVYETQTTGQVEYRNVRDADGTLIDGYKYTYDALGNITGIYESEIAEGQTERRPLALYEYDAQSQLTKETLYTYATDSNGVIRMNTEEWNYTYDSAGNLVGKQPVVKGITGAAKNYSYENEQWKDLLTAYDGEYILYEGQSLVEQEEPLTGVVTVRVSGEPISGNPIHYYNGMHYDMEWEQGRDLAESSFETQDHSASSQLQWVDKENTIGYSYDADGIRTSKAVVVDTYRYRTSSGGSIVSITPGNEANALDLPIKPYPGETYIRFLFGTKTVTHNYVTQNGKVVRETIDDGVSAKVLDFIYDTAGKPFALIYTNGTAEPETYYYVLNLQGDVVKLMDEDGAEIASYRYNAWGELLSVTDEVGEAITSASHIANLNPIRYRGYYYDSETGFYYLQSRYYDPANHRFINADGYASTGTGFLGHNMFAYCNNNPVMNTDATGLLPSISPLILPILFFMHGISDRSETYEGNRHVFDNDNIIGKMLGTLFPSSYTMQALIINCIDSISWDRNSFTFNDLTFNPYYYSSEADFALMYSVGEATISIVITHMGANRYYISYTVTDSYTFEYWDDTKGDSDTKIINNFGYSLAQKGVVNEYFWTFSGSFYYNYPMPTVGCSGGEDYGLPLHVK